MELQEKLQVYIDAKFPLIYICSFEEEKMDVIITKVAGNRRVFEWNELQRYRDMTNKRILNPEYGLKQVLTEGAIYGDLDRKILVIKDIQNYLDNQKIVKNLKNVCVQIVSGRLDTIIILVSSVVKIPKALEEYMTIIESEYLNEEEIEIIIEEFMEENKSWISEELKKEMVISFKGLSQMEIENILALVYVQDGEFTKKHLELILEQKYQTIKKSGILEMIPLSENMDDIGGLEELKTWIIKKAKILKNMSKAKAFGVELPKGVLIAGTPGCGKSLSAKATAKLMEIPLLKLDMGRIMGKYVGESEENMRKAIALAEAISPCVLWVDELEKAMSGIGNSGGSGEFTTRLFGQFLTWMQEKKSAVFVVATANNISKLPPELLRKGRFDEIFYVELPDEEERENIFRIHIGKRRKSDLSKINIKSLIDKTKGYSGADIEGVVRDAVEEVFVEGREQLTTEDLEKAIKNTHPLSEIMKKELEVMKKEYEERNYKKASKKER